LRRVLAEGGLDEEAAMELVGSEMKQIQRRRAPAEVNASGEGRSDAAAKESRQRRRKRARSKEEEGTARLKRAVRTVGNFAGSNLLCGTPLEVWFSDQHADWVAGNEAMVGRATCGTRAGSLAREQHGKDIALLWTRARVAERLTGVLKAAAAGNNNGVRYWRR
jgi:hypothetical protein